MKDKNELEEEIQLSIKRMSIIVILWNTITIIPLFFLLHCNEIIKTTYILTWFALLFVSILLSPLLVNKFWKDEK